RASMRSCLCAPPCSTEPTTRSGNKNMLPDCLQLIHTPYILERIAILSNIDYNANYNNVISRFSHEAICLSHWNTKVFMIKLIEVVTTMSTMRNHHSALFLPLKHIWVGAYHLVPEVY